MLAVWEMRIMLFGVRVRVSSFLKQPLGDVSRHLRTRASKQGAEELRSAC